MATCKNCVGYDFCSKNRDGLTDYYGEEIACNNVENLCCVFKNKADVQEVIHARWEICCDGYYPYCTNCSYEPPWVYMRDMRTPYCPNCGAKMEV